MSLCHRKMLHKNRPFGPTSLWRPSDTYCLHSFCRSLHYYPHIPINFPLDSITHKHTRIQLTYQNVHLRGTWKETHGERANSTLTAPEVRIGREWLARWDKRLLWTFIDHYDSHSRKPRSHNHNAPLRQASTTWGEQSILVYDSWRHCQSMWTERNASPLYVCDLTPIIACPLPLNSHIPLTGDSSEAHGSSTSHGQQAASGAKDSACHLRVLSSSPLFQMPQLCYRPHRHTLCQPH